MVPSIRLHAEPSIGEWTELVLPMHPSLLDREVFVSLGQLPHRVDAESYFCLDIAYLLHEMISVARHWGRLKERRVIRGENRIECACGA